MQIGLENTGQEKEGDKPKSVTRKFLFHFVRKDTVYLQIASKLLVFQMVMGDILQHFAFENL